MKYLIFDNLQDCFNRISQANSMLLQKITDPKTTGYCIPRKHPTQDLWCIPIEQKYIWLFDKEELILSQELTPDWTIENQFKH